jgi:arylsulfatase A-like enzyme
MTPPSARATVAALLALGVGACTSEEGAPKREVAAPLWAPPAVRRVAAPLVDNVVLISIDTLRRDYVSAYGVVPRLPVEHSTPNIDALAAAGSLCTDATSQAPTTGRSHHSFFHSLEPPVGKKIRFDEIVGGDVPQPIETLRAAGLATAAFTGQGQMNGAFGWTVGFDSYASYPPLEGDPLQSPERLRARVSGDLDARELTMIERDAFAWLDAHRTTPFFLFLHPYEVHCPHLPPAAERRRYTSWYRGGEIPPCPRTVAGLDAATRDYLRSLYGASVAFVDGFVGRLRDKLDALGIAQRTMIVLLSDHGEQLGEGNGHVGHNVLHPTVLEIPLIVLVPGIPPRRIDAPVAALDVMPTIYAALGLEPPYPFMGRSLLPAMTGAEAPNPDRVRFAHAARGRVSVRRHSWVLILGSRTRNVPPPLYDLAADPAQLRELGAAEPETTKDLMRAFLDMVTGSTDLARHFRIVRRVRRTDRPQALTEQLRALGYVQ